MKVSLLALACMLLGSLAAGAEELTLGEEIEGSTQADGMAVYTIEVEEAGLLTVAAHSTNDTNIKIIVADYVGQPLQDGEFNNDYSGEPNDEYGATVLHRAGEYQVMVAPSYGGVAEFVVMASWLPCPYLEKPADPDGSPGAANELATGAWVSDSLDRQGDDQFDWYRVDAPGNGLLIVRTRGEDGDLVLEAFQEDNYIERIDVSDQDIEQEAAREMLTLEVEEGEACYFRVRIYYGSTDYEIRATFAE